MFEMEEKREVEMLSFNSVDNRKVEKLHRIKITLCVLGVIVGVLCVVNAFMPGIFFALDAERNGRIAENVEFGGDFYTEVYAATRIAGSNIWWLAKQLEEALRIFEVLFGSATALGFGIKLCGLISRNEK